MNGAIVTGKIGNQAIDDGGLPVEALENLQDVEHVSGMLPVQGGDQLTAVELGGIKDRQDDVAREEFLGDRHERPLRDGQYGASKDQVDFDSDPQSVVFDEQFDVIAAFRSGQASAVAQGRNCGLGGFEVCCNCPQCVLAT